MFGQGVWYVLWISHLMGRGMRLMLPPARMGLGRKPNWLTRSAPGGVEQVDDFIGGSGVAAVERGDALLDGGAVEVWTASARLEDRPCGPSR